MIVPMKKATILVEAKDADNTIKDLRRQGVLHVQHQQGPCGKDISLLQEEIALLGAAFDTWKQAGSEEENQQAQKKIGRDWQAVARHIVELGKRLEHLEAYSRAIIQQVNEWEQWGDFDPQEIKELSQKGIYLRLYRVPLKEIKEFPGNAVVKNLFTSGGLAHCAVISREPFEIVFKEIILPKHSLSALKKRLAEDKKVMGVIKNEILKSAVFYEDFIEIRKKLEKEMEFRQVLSGMGKEGAIAYVTGFIPFDSEGRLISEAKNKKWGIVINEPAGEDIVPTLVRNPKWVSIIKPVLGLLGITPGYHELDVSMLFLVFFSIFFGILIGDAGYGLAYMLITIWLQKKMKQNASMTNAIPLFYLLSSCAIIWGVLTGTCFGQGWPIKLGYRPLIAQLNDAKFMQTFCFFLGALHLSLAHSWRASLKFPSLSALADVGWIGVLWSAFYLARTLILGEAFPGWVKWLITGGILLVVLFTSPQANILKAIGAGLGTVALSLMNNFTDVVSYVRLFAVGLAGVAISETTNVMASGLGSGAVALVGGVMITVIGHGLNLVLGPMSVLVHGVRLNVLEFSGHASVTWSGVHYQPLKE